MELAIKSDFDVNEIPTGQGLSLLGLAVCFDRDQMVALLIDAGANVEDKRGHNSLVLSCATNKRNRKIIQSMLRS